MEKVTDNIYILVILGMTGSFLLAGAFIVIFIHNQNRLLRQRQELQVARIAHQLALMQSVIASQEAERSRIGQDLHDSVGTALSGLRMNIDMYGRDGDWKTAIDTIILDVRSIAHNLSPPGLILYGFTGALEELCENISRSGRLDITVSNHAGDVTDKLVGDRAILLYRVMEELLNNTIRHARALHAYIDFTLPEGLLCIRYADDGIGMPAGGSRGKGMGLQNIESRLGIMQAGYSIASGGPGFVMQIHIKQPNTI